MCKSIVSIRRKWILVGGDDLTNTTETLCTAEDDGSGHPPEQGWKKVNEDAVIYGMTFRPQTMQMQPKAPSRPPKSPPKSPEESPEDDAAEEPEQKKQKAGGDDKGWDDESHGWDDTKGWGYNKGWGHDKGWDDSSDEEAKKAGWDEKNSWDDTKGWGYNNKGWDDKGWDDIKGWDDKKGWDDIKGNNAWRPPTPPAAKARAIGAAASSAGAQGAQSKGDKAAAEIKRGGWFNKCQALVDLIVEERWQDAKALAISLDCNVKRA